MKADEGDNPLPEVEKAPLVVDVEFVETEEAHDAPLLNAAEQVSTTQASGPMHLPSSLPTPAGRARVVTVINQKGGVEQVGDGWLHHKLCRAAEMICKLQAPSSNVCADPQTPSSQLG